MSDSSRVYRIGARVSKWIGVYNNFFLFFIFLIEIVFYH
jgi:hypothetical protein